MSERELTPLEIKAYKIGTNIKIISTNNTDKLYGSNKHMKDMIGSTHYIKPLRDPSLSSVIDLSGWSWCLLDFDVIIDEKKSTKDAKIYKFEEEEIWV